MEVQTVRWLSADLGWRVSNNAAEGRRGGPQLDEAIQRDGHVETPPPVVAEMPIVKRADVLLSPDPVPLDRRDDGVHDEDRHPPSEGTPMKRLVPGTAHPPDSSDGCDAEEVPKAEERRIIGGAGGPPRVVIREKDGEGRGGGRGGMEEGPKVKQPRNDWLDLGAGEKGMGDGFDGVGGGADGGGAKGGGSVERGVAVANVCEERVATNLSVKDAPRGDDEGGGDGRVKERSPNCGKGAARIRERRRAVDEGPSLRPGRAWGRRLESEPGRGGIEGKGIGFARTGDPSELGSGRNAGSSNPTPTFL